MTIFSGGGLSFTTLEEFATVEMDANSEETVYMDVEVGD